MNAFCWDFRIGIKQRNNKKLNETGFITKLSSDPSTERNVENTDNWSNLC